MSALVEAVLTLVPPEPSTNFVVVSDTTKITVAAEWETSTLDAIDFGFYQISRRKIDEDTGLYGEWVVIAEVYNQDQVLHEDYYAGLGVNYEYRHIVMQKITGGYLPSDPLTDSTRLEAFDTWLHGVSNPSVRCRLRHNPQRSFTRREQYVDHEFFGRRRPVRHWGVQDHHSANLSFFILADDHKQIAKLYDLMDAKAQVIYRDARGRVLIGNISNPTVRDVIADRGSFHEALSVDFVETYNANSDNLNDMGLAGDI
jgi:hypothetical protein